MGTIETTNHTGTPGTPGITTRDLPLHITVGPGDLPIPPVQPMDQHAVFLTGGLGGLGHIITLPPGETPRSQRPDIAVTQSYYKNESSRRNNLSRNFYTQ